jgi:hypothetical protein
LHNFLEGVIWDPDRGRTPGQILQELDIHLEDFSDRCVLFDMTVVNIVSSKITRQVKSSHVYADPVRRVSVTIYPGMGFSQRWR